jgi:GxxExxY protein
MAPRTPGDQERLACTGPQRLSPYTEVTENPFVAESLVLELKAVDTLLPIHSAQVVSYLKATACTLGLLISFDVSVLKQGIKRIIVS